jgi:hypothetical protein
MGKLKGRAIKMQIGVVDVDGHNFPNLPLMKISAYHKQRGDNVVWATGFEHFDILYMSKVFTFTPDILIYYDADMIIKGGTGYGLESSNEVRVKLPDEIEHIYPDYSIYPALTKNTAYGFLTRGCPRNCKFCVVSKKEGKCSRQVAELGEFWQEQKKIVLLDPNLLACRDREKILQSLIDSGAKIEFNQGLDIRFTDDIIAKMLKDIKTNSIHFAWDNPNDDLTRQFEVIKNITGFNDRKLCAYVLTNFNSTHEQDLYRVYKLREIGVNPYVMVYDKTNAPRQTKALQRWVNNKYIWRSCERFEDYNSQLG